MVKALDLSSNGRVVRVGSNPTPGILFCRSASFFISSQRLSTSSLAKKAFTEKELVDSLRRTY